MGHIREDVEQYLIRNYDASMRGPDLAKAIDIPERSARRYLSYYREHITSSTTRISVPQMNMDAVVFDIETTDFGTEGFSGHLVCCSFLPLNTGEVKTLQIEFDEHGDDRRLLEDVAQELAKYPFHIGHNIAAFDYNWLNSRLRFHSLSTLNTAVYFDTYQVAKSMALKTSKGLGNLVDYFGLEGVKTTIYRTSWSQVNSPYEVDYDRAISEITEHCALDVEANRRLLDVLHFYSMTNGRNCAWKQTRVAGNFWGGKH